jgi:hypothetical protein
MNAHWLKALPVTLLALALSAGCAAPSSGDDTAVDDPGASTSDLTASTDAAIEGKLRGILKDVTFTSEGDFPYVVFEGDAVTEKRLSTKLVRQKLAAAVKANSGDKRDILTPKCRARRESISEAIAAGSAVEVPRDKNDDDFVSAQHDRQLMIALKTMKSQLRGVVGFRFGENESGDQDEFGTVLFVYVGISKTTGKLIAIMTEAVFT